MGIHFKKNGNQIVYTKGMTNAKAIEFLKKRVAKREKEMQKRKWIYDEYNSLLKLNKLDNEWIQVLRSRKVVLEDE